MYKLLIDVVQPLSHSHSKPVLSKQWPWTFGYITQRGKGQTSQSKSDLRHFRSFEALSRGSQSIQGSRWLRGFAKYHQKFWRYVRSTKRVDEKEDCYSYFPFSDMAALRKIIFMYNSLMLENDSLASELMNQHVLEDLDTVLVKYTGQDEDLTEKVSFHLIFFSRS